MNIGGPMQWNAIAICATIKIYWLMEHSSRAQIRRTFRKTYFIMWSESGISDRYCERQSDASSIRQESPPRHLCGIPAICGTNLKRNILVANAKESQENHAPEVHVE